MALAKYIVQIPTHDNEGNRLVDLAQVAHESLFRYAPNQNSIQGSRVRYGIGGHWRDDPQEMFNDLEVYAEDTPELDSIVKQLAVHVAEVANQWGVMVFKEGDGAPKAWQMTAPGAPGEGPADPVAIAEYANPVTSALRRALRASAGLGT